MARPLLLMDIRKGSKSFVRFWSKTIGWFLVWKICHLWSRVENKMSLGVRILPFRQYWLTERWSKEAIRRIEEGGTGREGLWWWSLWSFYHIQHCVGLIYTHSWTVKYDLFSVVFVEICVHFSAVCWCWLGTNTPLLAHHYWVWLFHNKLKGTQ